MFCGCVPAGAVWRRDLPEEGKGEKDILEQFDSEVSCYYSRQTAVFDMKTERIMKQIVNLSVRENIMLPMVLDKQKSEECTQKGEEFAALFGLEHLLEKYPYEFSGGEKQRVAISRALINHPDLILADEPTGNLDSKSGETVINALEDINRNMGRTIVMVTHDPQMASHCKRILFLKDGVILEDLKREGTREEFYTQVIGRMRNL